MIDINRLQKTSGIIGNTETIQEVLEMIVQVGPVDITVLVTGESGTGKEKVAKAIHKSSKRTHEPLIIVNCGAIPEGIIESELFGHKKGAFTGAEGDRKGYFETANKGTVFLDEIGETPLETQVKLLRVLENGEFIRVGDSKTLHTDVRIIAATNKNLESLVKKGDFRQDLYYRLKTVSIHVPALRQRVEDLSLFVERFALEFTRTNDIVYRGFMPEAIRLMKQYNWPGNVRELKNFVESILVLEKGERVTSEMVERKLRPSLDTALQNPHLPVLVDQSPERVENELILRQLFLLRQDVELIRKIMNAQGRGNDTLHYINESVQDVPVTMEIDSKEDTLIRPDAIGDMTLEDLEKEAIKRTLKFFNKNRRAAARSLGMSERTLYRKINDYGLERKIKRKHEKQSQEDKK
ncbi:MAG TPA: sigma-54 dependent transcriptional regulator [Candidatus Marinimicrobia bacterium]|nr:sigma-54 dependent transcriptional regulator [Candidatus Neomarinimicrobiota bacterium]MDP6261852.1 sigma-54 dependent transcriptional regulator [Candidatus Neomarinimicrobiota bacterium]MDP7127976.1 sigma-54 dependent transcriptional regulator [Candidatus Neomarinimicrobiota bacterium]MDP7337189.1 sigma-54 dependent transcriptional regulator [Candidatus Neomarinimicrobiota bacterium]MDP7475632.1 sigma-54 dependent transcriptional regulator [Candidatus Neomarinimicrobiota bacterium]